WNQLLRFDVETLDALKEVEKSEARTLRNELRALEVEIPEGAESSDGSSSGEELLDSDGGDSAKSLDSDEIEQIAKGLKRDNMARIKESSPKAYHHRNRKR
ncbi:unnamed protein product, partial [Amoebophrya sp. A25]